MLLLYVYDPAHLSKDLIDRYVNKNGCFCESFQVDMSVACKDKKN